MTGKAKKSTPIKRHPCAVAWENFCTTYPTTVIGAAAGLYLKNRLQLAFEEGWSAGRKRRGHP